MKWWCSEAWFGFNNGFWGTSRVGRIQPQLSIDGLKTALISLNVSNSGFLLLLRMKALSVVVTETYHAPSPQCWPQCFFRDKASRASGAAARVSQTMPPSGPFDVPMTQAHTVCWDSACLKSVISTPKKIPA